MGNSLNLQEIDQEQALYLSKFYINAQQNFFLFGQSGIGKTQIITKAIIECKYKVNYVNLSVVERPDLAGYPDLHSTDDIVNFKSPSFLPKLLNSKPDSIILFDEVDKAPPEVTAPLLEILQYRSVHGKKINAACCILTGNMLNEGAYSNQISTALLDRGAKYILSFNFDKWLEWAQTNNVHDLILGFLRSNPDLTCGKLEDVSYASPSPRGWTMASEALIKARELKIVDIDFIAKIISGYVGYEAGLRFQTWYEHFRRFEPHILSLLDSGEMTIDYNKLPPTEKVIFVITACHFTKNKIVDSKIKNKFFYLENLCNFAEKYQVEPEIKVIGFNNSFSVDLITKYKLYTCKIFFNLFNKINEGMSIKI